MFYCENFKSPSQSNVNNFLRNEERLEEKKSAGYSKLTSDRQRRAI